MTIPATTRKAGPLLGNGATTTFPFAFKVFAASDVKVTVADNLGTETELVLNTHYTVTLNGNQETSPGGTVTYPISGSPLATNSTLTITGSMANTQPLDLPSGGNFSPLALENQLDRTTIQIQQLAERLDRTLTAPVNSTASPVLPMPEASSFIAWNENANGLENYPISNIATALAFATFRYDTFTGDGSTTQYTLSADPVTLGNLDVAVSGVTQIPGVDYTLSNGVLSFSSAPPNGTSILARFGEGVVSGPSMDSYDVRFQPAGTGAVQRTAESKLREVVSVKDFGAVCDGVTDDWDAIHAAQEYLKANGGGTLYFPGFCRITKVFHFYGSITGAWGQLYPEPNEKKIVWASNGNGGIVSTISSGDVLRLSKSLSDTLEYKVGFKDFVINCSVNNVVAINGLSQTGIYGANHHVDIDNLLIHGIEGADAIGIDFGTITDSQVRGLKVQGWGTGPYAGVRFEKTDVQLINCMFVYCRNSVVIGGQLAEACVQAVGCQFLNPKSYHVFWEATAPDSKASSSIISASFVGECTHPGSAILGAATPATLDIGAFTFEGCTFDNYRSGQNLMDITWGGRFTFIGNNFYDAGAGGLASIKFGDYCKVMWLNNGLTIDATSTAIVLANVNRFDDGVVSGTGVGVGGARAFASGITFPASAVSVGDPNVLDDYEEGTFTPTLTFDTPGNLSVSYTRNTGRYQKIGNTVYVSLTIVTSSFTHTTASGNLRVVLGALPNIANNSGNYSASGVQFEGITKAGYTSITLEMVPGQAYVVPVGSGSGVAVSAVTAADVPTGTRKIFQGQFSYTV